MRNLQYIALAWGKNVHNFCTTCVSSISLCTHEAVDLRTIVHKPSKITLTCARLVPRLVHYKTSLLVSVRALVMPTIHTPYKENNKSKILKITLLVSYPNTALKGAKS